MIESLEAKIKKVKDEHKLEVIAKTKLEGLKVLTFISEFKCKKTKNIVVDLVGMELTKITESIKLVLQQIRPLKSNASFKMNDKTINTHSPFIFKFDNNCKYTQYCNLEYSSIGNVEVTIKIPLQFYDKDELTYEMRAITECEHHYFIGCSARQLNDIRVHRYWFADFEKVKYYGGSVTNYCGSVGDKKDFEFIIVNGSYKEYLTYPLTKLSK